MTIQPGPDGRYHPHTNAEIIALVHLARKDGRKLRVHGDGHSVAHAIHADPLGPIDNKVKPPPPRPGRNLNLVLDYYGHCGTIPGIPGWRPVRGEYGVIEVDGGMVLGSGRGGQGPTGLLQQLHEDGWMLRSTGGIAHQTIAGFMATASAGGSLQCSVSELVCGVQLIDGTGAVRSLREDHPDFRAVIPHLGLLGIVIKVWLRCTRTFTVKGTQVTRSPQDSAVDLFGAGGTSGPGARKSLAEFLTDAQYARIEWWPQRGCERVRVWEGTSQGPPAPGFEEQRFHMFKPGQQLLAGFALTALGNLRDSARMRGELETLVKHARESENEGLADGDAVSNVVPNLRGMGLLGRWVASNVEAVDDNTNGDDDRRKRIERLLMRVVPFLLPRRFVRLVIRWKLPGFFPRLLDEFAPTNKDDVVFHDHAWRLLPMDDEVDDVYLPVEFTEIWVPLKHATVAMSHLHDHFARPKGARAAFAGTGTFSIELYATKKSAFWLDPAYSEGTDDWSEGALRINPYWYGRNADDPTEEFFPSFWKLLRNEGVPYRLHWGKFLPRLDKDPAWPAWIRNQYPRWNEFMKVRGTYDPGGIFVNDYWRKHLGPAPPCAVDDHRIADLHCHYPMHVLADWSRTARRERRLCRGRWSGLDYLRCLSMKSMAVGFNHENPWASWRVSLPGLQQARAGLVLSVLYDPVYELLVIPRKQHPRPTAFKALICQLDSVEADLIRKDPANEKHIVVTSEGDLTTALGSGRIAFVHCVEGALYLGDNVHAIRRNIDTLSNRGVAYITLAHLFYRGIASNTCALPKVRDGLYDLIFRQRDRGLSALGRAVIEAMYKHRMLIDVAHLDAAAMWETFELLEELDAASGAAATDHPVIASHAGYRFGKQDYMLDAETIREIASRGGVIGLILAKHQLQDGMHRGELRQSRFHAVERHIAKICEITGSHKHTCIGSDHDGFIKPTVSKLHRSANLQDLDGWLRGHEIYADAADAILFGNAERVVSTRFR